jgi:hypothetical protein
MVAKKLYLFKFIHRYRSDVLYPSVFFKKKNPYVLQQVCWICPRTLISDIRTLVISEIRFDQDLRASIYIRTRRPVTIISKVHPRT